MDFSDIHEAERLIRAAQAERDDAISATEMADNEVDLVTGELHEARDEINALKSELLTTQSRADTLEALSGALEAQLREARTRVAKLEVTLKDSSFNCPACGRHDFGLAAGPGSRCRAEHDGAKVYAHDLHVAASDLVSDLQERAEEEPLMPGLANCVENVIRVLQRQPAALRCQVLPEDPQSMKVTL
jgi:chromosome segregation ATPase